MARTFRSREDGAIIDRACGQDGFSEGRALAQKIAIGIGEALFEVVEGCGDADGQLAAQGMVSSARDNADLVCHAAQEP
jgi:hypothetical protein